MLRKILIASALRILKSLVFDKIEYEPVKAFVGGSYGRLEKIATIVTDNETDNKAQFAQFWKQEKAGIVSDTLTTAHNIIEVEVKDSTVKEVVIGLIEEIKAEIDNGGLLNAAA